MEAIDWLEKARAIARVAEPNKEGQKAIEYHIDQAIAVLTKQPDWFNGQTIETETGNFWVGKRDGGIEVWKKGRLLFSSTKAKQAPCQTCGGSGYIGPHPGPYTKNEPHANPCPDCQAPRPEQSEFVKNILDFTDCTIEELQDKLTEAISMILKKDAENERLKEILKPFAEFSTLVDITRNETTITLKDFMQAKQALRPKEKQDEISG